MAIQSTTRVIRGGRALETVYWHYVQDRSGPKFKVLKHGRTLVLPKKMVPQASVVAEQALGKVISRL